VKRCRPCLPSPSLRRVSCSLSHGQAEKRFANLAEEALAQQASALARLDEKFRSRGTIASGCQDESPRPRALIRAEHSIAYRDTPAFRNRDGRPLSCLFSLRLKHQLLATRSRTVFSELARPEFVARSSSRISWFRFRQLFIKGCGLVIRRSWQYRIALDHRHRIASPQLHKHRFLLRTHRSRAAASRMR
jgi:hypothetical protein